MSSFEKLPSIKTWAKWCVKRDILKCRYVRFHIWRENNENSVPSADYHGLNCFRKLSVGGKLQNDRLIYCYRYIWIYFWKCSHTFTRSKYVWRYAKWSRFDIFTHLNWRPWLLQYETRFSCTWAEINSDSNVSSFFAFFKYTFMHRISSTIHLTESYET